MVPVLAFTQNEWHSFCCSRLPAPAAAPRTQDSRPLPLSPGRGWSNGRYRRAPRLSAVSSPAAYSAYGPSLGFASFGRPAASSLGPTVRSPCAAAACPVLCRRRDRAFGRPRALARACGGGLASDGAGRGGSKTSRTWYMDSLIPLPANTALIVMGTTLFSLLEHPVHDAQHLGSSGYCGLLLAPLLCDANRGRLLWDLLNKTAVGWRDVRLFILNRIIAFKIQPI